MGTVVSGKRARKKRCSIIFLVSRSCLEKCVVILSPESTTSVKYQKYHHGTVIEPVQSSPPPLPRAARGGRGRRGRTGRRRRPRRPSSSSSPPPRRRVVAVVAVVAVVFVVFVVVVGGGGGDAIADAGPSDGNRMYSSAALMSVNRLKKKRSDVEPESLPIVHTIIICSGCCRLSVVVGAPTPQNVERNILEYVDRLFFSLLTYAIR